MKKLYPIDWKKIHPDQMSTATDHYYIEVANQVLDVLEASGVAEALLDEEAIRGAAVRMTAWFEDICSNLGIWRVVGETCQKRYGKPLPFYDTEDYYPGEPNLQDVRLLLWDIIQSWHSDRIINPENPALLQTAEIIYNIFDEEYEYAPETDELIDYLSRPELGNEYWTTRKAIEWLSLSSYISLRGKLELTDAMADRINKGLNDRLYYAARLAHVFTDRHNLLSLTAAEWLASAIGRPFSIDTSHLPNRYYTIEDSQPSALQLKDLASNASFKVEADSFDEQWFKQYGRQTGQNIFCGLVGFNGAYYQCGAMVHHIKDKQIEKDIEDIRQEDHMKDVVKDNEKLFYEASKGQHIVFLKGVDAWEKFYTEDLGMEIPIDKKKQMKDIIAEQTDDGMIALMGTPDQGILTITLSIPAIKAPNNPFYDAEYAKKHAHELICFPYAIDYSAACLLLKEGYLSDAALSSLSGYQHGRKLMQDNAQFLMDYMFAEHQ